MIPQDRPPIPISIHSQIIFFYKSHLRFNTYRLRVFQYEYFYITLTSHRESKFSVVSFTHISEHKTQKIYICRHPKSLHKCCVKFPQSATTSLGSKNVSPTPGKQEAKVRSIIWKV
jgi:hypothetical protein